MALLRTAMMGWAPVCELERLKTLASKCVDILKELEPIVLPLSIMEDEDNSCIAENSPDPSVSEKHLLDTVNTFIALTETVKEARIELYGDVAELVPSEVGEYSSSKSGRVLGIGDEGMGIGTVRDAQVSLDRQRWDPMLRRGKGRVREVEGGV